MGSVLDDSSSVSLDLSDSLAPHLYLELRFNRISLSSCDRRPEKSRKDTRQDSLRLPLGCGLNATRFPVNRFIYVCIQICILWYVQLYVYALFIDQFCFALRFFFYLYFSFRMPIELLILIPIFFFCAPQVPVPLLIVQFFLCNHMYTVYMGKSIEVCAFFLYSLCFRTLPSILCCLPAELL